VLCTASKRDTRKHVDTCRTSREDTTKCVDTHRTSRQDTKRHVDTCGTSREDTKKHVDTHGTSMENTEKHMDIHGSPRWNRERHVDTCRTSREDTKKHVDTCGMSQRIWAMNSGGTKTSETPEYRWTWTTSDSTNSRVKKEMKNESLSGMAASVAIYRGRQFSSCNGYIEELPTSFP
jgi:hypothetical protein